MSEFLTRDKVLAYRGEIVEFDAPELGGSLPLRAIGFRDLMEVQKIADDVERAVAFIRLGIVDPESGEPMFGEEEFPAIANHWSTGLFKGVAEKLRDLSGADEDTQAAIEGNSEQTQEGGSPIS